MTDEIPPANRMSELPAETREFLSRLSPEDIETIQAGLPIVRQVMGFGKVLKWLAIAALSMLAGIVLLGESVVKILGWFKGG